MFGRKIQRRFQITFPLLAVLLFLNSCKASSSRMSEGEQGLRIYRAFRSEFKSLLNNIYGNHKDFKSFKPNMKRLVITDFDHTLANTLTSVKITKADGSVDSVDSKCFQVPSGARTDFGVFTADALKQTKINPAAVKRITSLRENAYVIVVTARSQEHSWRSILEFGKKNKIDLYAVIPVNAKLLHDSLWKKIKVQYKIPKGMKKGLLVIALVEYAAAFGAHIDEVYYLEDTDKYISAYINLTQNIFAEKKFHVYDFQRKFQGENPFYVDEYLGYTIEDKYVSASGMITGEVRKFSSADCSE